MAEKSLLSKEKLEKILQRNVKAVIKDITTVSMNAIEKFYADYTPKKYRRSEGMYGLVLSDITKRKIKNGYSIKFRFSSNQILSPTIPQQHMHGQVDGKTALDAIYYYDFLLGYHGGPQSVGNGIYSIENTPRMSQSPWNIIVDHINKKYGKQKSQRYYSD